jgi:hypothetical protein
MVQTARKFIKNEKKTVIQSPGPREYGFWIIQTYQGRWIDPDPKNLNQTVAIKVQE